MKNIEQLIVLILFPAVILCACGQQQDGVINPVATATTTKSPIDALNKSASAGDVKAQLELAERLEKGIGVGKDVTAAFEWYLKAAESGNSDAMMEVAARLSAGKGVTQDVAKGKVWRKKAADAGNAEAQFLASLTFGRTDKSTYIFGEKTDKVAKQENARQYLEWLGKAAKQNHPEAMYALGMTYLRGAVGVHEMLSIRYSDGDASNARKIVEPDHDKAVPLLKKSADAGYWQAQWALGILYQSGLRKIKSDKAESQRYWKMLEEQTDPDVQYAIGSRYHESFSQSYNARKNQYQGRELSFEETNKVALDWFQKAADKNHGEALYALGKMYRDELGPLNDEHRSVALIKRAAELGNEDAIPELAFALLAGRGIAADYAEAHKWLIKAANQNSAFVDSAASVVHMARDMLGAQYEKGIGIGKDAVLAYAWYNVSASGGFKTAKMDRERVERSLKPEELAEAQTLSRDWHPGKPMVRLNAINQSAISSDKNAPNSSSLKLAGSGTGFYISPNGNVLTNNHVIGTCKEIRIPLENAVAKVVVADQANDLALIKIDVTGRSSLSFPDDDVLKQGEGIFVFGFPLDGYLPSTGNITPGIISALAGPGNNTSLLQITAPVQQGNSGGPLLNKKGRAIGVVVGKVDVIKVAKITGDIPQNVNFAISARTVKSFLDGNRVEYRRSGDMFAFDKNAVEIADEARLATLKIECWR